MTPRLISAIAALARAMPRNPLVLEVLEAQRVASTVSPNTALEANAANTLANPMVPTVANAANAPRDRRAYQRELMRKRRAAARGKA